MLADLTLKSSINDNGDGNVTVKWEYPPEDLPKFVEVAKQATSIVRTPAHVRDALYLELMGEAVNKNLFVDPSSPAARAHYQKHGKAPRVQFLTGDGFFEATFDKMYSHVVFSLFGAPGAMGALDMQLKAFNAHRKGTETSQERALRVVGGIAEMLKQIDSRHQGSPEGSQPTDEQRARDKEASVHVKKEAAGTDGVPPMPADAVVKEELV